VPVAFFKKNFQQRLVLLSRRERAHVLSVGGGCTSHTSLANYTGTLYFAEQFERAFDNSQAVCSTPMPWHLPPAVCAGHPQSGLASPSCCDGSSCSKIAKAEVWYHRKEADFSAWKCSSFHVKEVEFSGYHVKEVDFSA